MKKKPRYLLVYILGIYVFLQFIWWGFHLVDLTKSQATDEDIVQKRVIMIIGEGFVFLTLVGLGLWKIISSIRKEMRMSQAQRNFMLAVTHELKTPISAVKLSLQTLQRKDLTEEQKTTLYTRALEENQRLQDLVERILTASRLEQKSHELQKSSFNIIELTQEVITLTQSRFSVNIEFKESPLFEVYSDRFLIYTILNNLVENAVKYGNSERGIQLTVSKIEYACKIRVQDFGKGIQAEQIPLLFQKFVRLENEETRSTTGTGLGLYIAQECARTVGGNVSYIKTPQGACFEIEIPYE
jgi:signal transduction histidine kinase